jgi:hypothetical protein
MDDYTKTLLTNVLVNCHRGSLQETAAYVLYKQLVVIPLQRAWRRKNHELLRQKYICWNCNEVIKYEVNIFQHRRCQYIEKYLADESQRLDSFVF